MSQAISNYHLNFLFLCCFFLLFFSSTYFYSSVKDFEHFPHLRTISSISTQVLNAILNHFFDLVKVKSKWQRNLVLKRTASYIYILKKTSTNVSNSVSLEYGMKRWMHRLKNFFSSWNYRKTSSSDMFHIKLIKRWSEATK